MICMWDGSHRLQILNFHSEYMVQLEVHCTVHVGPSVQKQIYISLWGYHPNTTDTISLQSMG